MQGLSADATSHKAVLNTIQSGEDAYKTAPEAANSLPFVLGARLARHGGNHS